MNGEDWFETMQRMNHKLGVVGTYGPGLESSRRILTGRVGKTYVGS